MTWVAPRDLSLSSLRLEAIVIMGENPDNFANWIAEVYKIEYVYCREQSKTNLAARQRMNLR